MRRITRGVSFDYLVGAGEQRRRDDEADRSRGFEIHGQLKFGGLHYRQVRSVLALENSLGDRLLRKPITGIAACCARAATGQAAAPPSVAKNFRRSM
jgi:hypothetical protein